MSAGVEELRAAVEKLCGQDREPFSSAGSQPNAGDCRMVRQIITSFMLWESTLSRAERAMQAIDSELTDANELRVCLPSELISIIGPRYPRAEERCLRLRATLNAIFESEHRTALPELETLGKREARTALESLDGMLPFVAARVVLIELGGHAFPVDSRVTRLLQPHLDPQETASSVGSKLERAFRAGEVAPIYAALERRLDKPARTSRSASRSRKAGSRSP